MDKLKHHVDFDYKLNLVKDGRYGSIDANGKWTGLIGEVIRGDADMAVAPLTVTATRSSVVDFTTPFFVNTLGAVFKAPANGKPIPVNSFLDTTKLNHIHYLTISGGSTYQFFTKSNYTKFNKVAESLRSADLLSLISHGIAKARNCSKTLFISERSLLEIATLKQPCDLSFVEFQEFPALSADLLSLISHGIAKARNCSKTLFISERSLLEIATLKQPCDLSFVEFQELSADLPSSVSDGIERARNCSKTLFISEYSLLESAAMKHPCDLSFVAFHEFPAMYAIALPKDSHMRQSMDLAILKMKEDGCLAELYHKWFKSDSECPKKRVCSCATSPASSEETAEFGEEE